jgi:hypothetical protein
MCDYFATENWLDTQEKIDWYFRNKSVWKKMHIFTEETVDKHFDEIKRNEGDDLYK